MRDEAIASRHVQASVQDERGENREESAFLGCKHGSVQDVQDVQAKSAYTTNMYEAWMESQFPIATKKMPGRPGRLGHDPDSGLKTAISTNSQAVLPGRLLGRPGRSYPKPHGDPERPDRTASRIVIESQLLTIRYDSAPDGVGWFVDAGDRVDVSDAVRRLASRQAGYSPAWWWQHMTYLAGRCEEWNPQRASDLRQAARMMESRQEPTP